MGISKSTEDDQLKAAFRHVEQYFEGFNCPLHTMLLFLLRAGCDLEATDNDGRSPSDYAAENLVLWGHWGRALDDFHASSAVDEGMVEI